MTSALRPVLGTATASLHLVHPSASRFSHLVISNLVNSAPRDEATMALLLTCGPVPCLLMTTSPAVIQHHMLSTGTQARARYTAAPVGLARIALRQNSAPHASGCLPLPGYLALFIKLAPVDPRLIIWANSSAQGRPSLGNEDGLSASDLHTQDTEQAILTLSAL
ncbi:hypothetical protein GQ607_002892 [Colletotrichum asianum]|uniref:Uncharacterized protein n=1 Tax=Colletotrichum asianum TaxID=702518 RepID=A0A8H3WMR3_9PEZI|nr:hypothetical protein GQ607_002892 [Colletotrichum asianum]